MRLTGRVSSDVDKHLWTAADKLRANVDDWNLEEEEGVTAAMMREIALELSRRVKDTLAIPLTQRGKQG